MDTDPTMSQDTAFASNEKQEDVFKFEEETATQSSQDETATTEDTSSSAEEEEAVVEEQKVPYSRFKRKVDELNETQSQIQMLEDRLKDLETSRTESKPTEEVNVPPEWIELYGDSDVSKKAWNIQLAREQKLQEQAVSTALKQLRDEQENEGIQQAENESVIDDNLESLQETLGKKLSPKTEEAILSIVDEFSPVGRDGKYLSLFPFDKAYEIYELRSSKQGQATNRARKEVADLTGNSSEGEAEAQGSDFKRGWDTWRETL